MEPVALNKLQHGAWYYGDSAYGPVARWDSDAEVFETLADNSSKLPVVSMRYGERGFTPYMVIDASFTPLVLEQVRRALTPLVQ